MKSNSEIAEMSIIPMLAAVLTGQIAIGPGSERKRKSHEVQRGVITSRVTRRLFTVCSVLGDRLRELDEEHDRLHDKPVELSAHDCLEFRNRLVRLLSRRDMLKNLLWQSIAEEHPQVTANSAHIRDGWLLVDEDGEWNDITPVTDRSNIANSFISRVKAIVTGARCSVGEENLAPVGIGEEVVGTLDDERVQTFYSLMDDIERDFHKALPFEEVSARLKSPGDMTLKEVRGLHVTLSVFKKLSEKSRSLFWCGVRDAVPEASNLPNIGIRRCCEVVKLPVPDDEADEDVQLVNTPFGPAISIKVPMPMSGALEQVLQKLMGGKRQR